MADSDRLDAPFDIEHVRVRALFDIEHFGGKLNGAWGLWEMFHMKHRGAG
jgi:hypothetical protein